MTVRGVEAWQIPILVTAAILLVEAGVNAVLRRRPATVMTHRKIRTVLLGLLLGLTVVVFVAALGPSLADELSSVAAAVAAVVAMWLTYRSYQSSREVPPPPPPPPHVETPPPPPPPPVPVGRRRWRR